VRYVEVAGVRLSVVGVGCWQFGSRDWGYGEEYGDTTAGLIVNRALDLGVTLIDTAEVYARGASEAIVGRAVRTRRGDAFVATKLLPVWPTAERTYEHGRLSRLRMGLDAIDLYQVHARNPLVPLASTMAGMRRLLDDGIIRQVGVSNFSASAWRAAEDALGSPVLSNQVQYNLLFRKHEAGNLLHARSEDRLVIAYSPLAKGLLGGRYDAGNVPTSPARRNEVRFLPENLDRAAPVIDALRRTAAAHDATPAQVALAWVLRRPNVVVIPGASSVEQLERNVEAADLELSADEDAELTAASDAYELVGPAAAARGFAAQRLGPRSVGRKAA
jgi:aryl-alcohol dehydrogenase-like predicted oxidoreductase